MPESLTIQLARPISAVSPLGAAGTPEARGADRTENRGTSAPIEAAVQAEHQRMLNEIERQENQLTELCKIVGDIAAKLDRLHQETLASHRSDIAKLSVEIARKILMYKISKGDHDIQAIVEEAVKRAPTRQNITVRVNPEDLSACQQLQQGNPDRPLAELDFVADGSIARADCLVETPKGVVKSFVEEHLERISEALAKVE